MAVYQIVQILANDAPIPFPKYSYYSPVELVYQIPFILEAAATALGGDTGFPELHAAAVGVREAGVSCLHDGTITFDKVAITYEVIADFPDNGIYF